MNQLVTPIDCDSFVAISENPDRDGDEGHRTQTYAWEPTAVAINP